jgi:hypothetical protein
MTLFFFTMIAQAVYSNPEFGSILWTKEHLRKTFWQAMSAHAS